jgi:RNA recognition motif-containing protein
VAGFPLDVDEEELERLFCAYGYVENVKIWRDRETSRPVGWAFVEMEHERQAERAIEQLHGRWYRDREVGQMANPKVNRRKRGRNWHLFCPQRPSLLEICGPKSANR